jgi:hypothetical protein
MSFRKLKRAKYNETDEAAQTAERKVQLPEVVVRDLIVCVQYNFLARLAKEIEATIKQTIKFSLILSSIVF